MDTPSKYSMRLADLERSAKVPRDEQVEVQEVDVPHDMVAPEELERQRLLGISGAGG